MDVGIATVLTGVLLRLLLARFAVRTRLLLFVVSLAAAVAPAAYLILRDSLGGKSVGKLLVGLVVINPVRRKRGGFTDSVLRNLVFGFAVVPVIGWVIVLVLFGISAVAIVRGKGIRIGEGLTDARVMDDRSAELEL